MDITPGAADKLKSERAREQAAANAKDPSYKRFAKEAARSSMKPEEYAAKIGAGSVDAAVKNLKKRGGTATEAEKKQAELAQQRMARRDPNIFQKIGGAIVGAFKKKADEAKDVETEEKKDTAIPPADDFKRIRDNFPLRDMDPELLSHCRFQLTYRASGEEKLRVLFTKGTTPAQMDAVMTALKSKTWLDNDTGGKGYEPSAEKLPTPIDRREGVALRVIGADHILNLLDEIQKAERILTFDPPDWKPVTQEFIDRNELLHQFNFAAQQKELGRRAASSASVDANQSSKTPPRG